MTFNSDADADALSMQFRSARIFFGPVPKLESATFFGEASKPFSGSKNFFFNGFRLLLKSYSADMALWHCQSVVQSASALRVLIDVVP